jgi:hypothetical protein
MLHHEIRLPVIQFAVFAQFHVVRKRRCAGSELFPNFMLDIEGVIVRVESVEFGEKAPFGALLSPAPRDKIFVWKPFIPQNRHLSDEFLDATDNLRWRRHIPLSH